MVRFVKLLDMDGVDKRVAVWVNDEEWSAVGVMVFVDMFVASDVNERLKADVGLSCVPNTVTVSVILMDESPVEVFVLVLDAEMERLCVSGRVTLLDMVSVTNEEGDRVSLADRRNELEVVPI